MLVKPECFNYSDAEGNPAGGEVRGVGIRISWQNGSLGRGEERKEPNGAFVESVIYAALQRIKHYQDGRFSCYENRHAINALQEALFWLHARTQRREAALTEGTHQGN